MTAATTTDEIYNAIISHTSIDSIKESLFPLLTSTPANLFTLPLSDNQDPLALLNPAEHSLGYLYFLTAKGSQENADLTLLYQHVLNFLEHFDKKQIACGLKRFYQLAPILIKFSSASGKPILATRPLRLAIQKIVPEGTLTPLHPILIKECLLGKLYTDALSVLDTNITELDPKTTHIKVQDHLLYHYYGAMVYIGLKKFSRAAEFLELVIATPSLATSAIQVEAYKKQLLVSLLLEGQLISLPKYTAQCVIQNIKVLCAPYLDFASAYSSLNMARVRAELGVHESTFIKDKNHGLILQCLDALYRRNILQLTRTYLTLSMEDIARTVGLEGPTATQEAEKYVLQMIESGDIFASIHYRPEGSMVSFEENPDCHNTSETLAILHQKLQLASEIGKRVGKMEQDIACSKEYLAKILLSRNNEPVSMQNEEMDFIDAP
ncbi:hypothetical protein K493DRAFT_404095 [Basidiobolus meristosporus CBS 931.73]|uniref:COP9 signalosome complex subunit 3 n=1 Tax=Basidiobolus meristosporus CBS 931.73 TaxID=1314790 RepID=A0A1Y1Z851_9FUNG|nr:hypothetical protein K493DRAFT_404095 [Basidiobolus meristosporus CBS 931.73]|eukprot:ORY06177.1 hypothetical protein K493DRAFT_404095 [Basidiobolus meristosporus CBS 931.73]